jgi:hypothetical protein
MSMINYGSCSGIYCLHTAAQNTAEDIGWVIMGAGEVSFVRQVPGREDIDTCY